MKNESLISLVLSFFAVLILLSGCYDPGGPEPGGTHTSATLVYTQADVDAMVVMEQESIYSPAPSENGTAPCDCNYIKFTRYRLNNATLGMSETPENANYADACLLMVPGVVEGANGFEYIARNLVYQAKKDDNLKIEVWAMDRRNNCIEDLNGCQAMEKMIDAEYDLDIITNAFIGYYYRDETIGEYLDNDSYPSIDGIDPDKTFAGFLKDKDAPYLSEFGLKIDTEDMYKIITTMVPNQADRKKKVFVGGHSLGGVHTSMFAGWDIDGNPDTDEDAGWKNCAGLFCFDSIVSSTRDVIEPYVSLLPDSIFNMGEDMTEAVYIGIVKSLQSGLFPRIVPILNGEVMCLIEALGGLAYYYGDDEFTVLRELPYTNNIELILRAFHSRDLNTFTDGVPHIKDFRYTNEAALGVLFDDDFSPLGMIQVSMGFLNGGAVVPKDFPIPGDLKDVPILENLIGFAVSDEEQFIANDAGPDDKHLGEGPRYTWADFDEIGNAADPEYKSTDGSITYTTMADEVSNIHDFARALFIGETNLTEWYFSTRCLVDIMAATLSYGPKYGLNFLWSDEVGKLPKIEFVGEDGVIDPFSCLLPSNKDTITGFCHLDPMFASANTPGHRQNDVIRPLINFVKDHI